jgi:hypothetical protein
LEENPKQINIFRNSAWRMPKTALQPETVKSSDLSGEKAEEKGGVEMVSILKVKGMSCQHCVMAVTKALSQLEGIQNIGIDLAKGEVSF